MSVKTAEYSLGRRIAGSRLFDKPYVDPRILAHIPSVLFPSDHIRHKDIRRRDESFENMFRSVTTTQLRRDVARELRGIGHDVKNVTLESLTMNMGTGEGPKEHTGNEGRVFTVKEVPGLIIKASHIPREPHVAEAIKYIQDLNRILLRSQGFADSLPEIYVSKAIAVDPSLRDIAQDGTPIPQQKPMLERENQTYTLIIEQEIPRVSDSEIQVLQSGVEAGTITFKPFGGTEGAYNALARNGIPLDIDPTTFDNYGLFVRRDVDGRPTEVSEVYLDDPWLELHQVLDPGYLVQLNLMRVNNLMSVEDQNALSDVVEKLITIQLDHVTSPQAKRGLEDILDPHNREHIEHVDRIKRGLERLAK